MKNISKATKKNWEKLNVDESKKKLEHRANKTMSTKKIIPKELLKNQKNIIIIKQYIDYVSKNYKDYDLEKIMRSFCIKLLIEKGLVDENLKTDRKNISIFLEENKDIYRDILELDLPEAEEDILGIIYQCFQNEGDKNKNGVYYTPENIVKNMVSQMMLSEHTRILDPCCGTGNFLLQTNLKNPNNLFGIDIDKIAVMIAKVNLFIKYKEIDFMPNLYVLDFLKDNIELESKEKFDYIITNPPWGADVSYINNSLYREIRSKESFSYMIIKSNKYLKEEGSIIFLLPESFLNVKIHSDIREYLLKRMMIEKITLYQSSFSGVLTKFISLKVKKYELNNYNFEIEDLGKKTVYSNTSEEIINNTNYSIPIHSNKDKVILKKIFSCEYNTLKDSIWALGIVTGDNEGKLKKVKTNNLEPIYTGKEIVEYKLLPAKNFIEYKRNDFQQVAPDRIYRADEKLVYKFISKNLIFAYDDKRSLFLNSANILIPNIEGMSIKTCMAFLNSKLFKYIYMKQFGEIKILKGNLEKLPFPIITPDENNMIEKMCDNIINGKDNYKDVINKEIYKIFNLEDEEIEYIEKQVK